METRDYFDVVFPPLVALLVHETNVVNSTMSTQFNAYCKQRFGMKIHTLIHLTLGDKSKFHKIFTDIHIAFADFAYGQFGVNLKTKVDEEQWEMGGEMKDMYEGLDAEKRMLNTPTVDLSKVIH